MEAVRKPVLIACSELEEFDVRWWREGTAEVDFVVSCGADAVAIEVKSGRVKRSGLAELCRRYPKAQPMLIGDRNISVEAFLHGDVPLFS